MAPAVKTFLHQQDFTGKTVVPFMTNGGWPGHVIKDMKAACKGANVVCDMQIQFDSTGEVIWRHLRNKLMNGYRV